MIFFLHQCSIYRRYIRYFCGDDNSSGASSRFPAGTCGKSNCLAGSLLVSYVICRMCIDCRTMQRNHRTYFHLGQRNYRPDGFVGSARRRLSDAERTSRKRTGHLARNGATGRSRLVSVAICTPLIRFRQLHNFNFNRSNLISFWMIGIPVGWYLAFEARPRYGIEGSDRSWPL